MLHKQSSMLFAVLSCLLMQCKSNMHVSNEELEEKIATLKNKQDALQTSLEDKATALKDLEGKYESLKTDLGDKKIALADLESQCKALNNDLSALKTVSEKEIKDLIIQYTALNAAASALRAELANKLKDLENKCNVATSAFRTELTVKLKDLKNEYNAALKAALSALETNLYAKVGALGGKLGTLQGACSKLSAEVEALKKKPGTGISHEESQVLANKIDDVKKELDRRLKVVSEKFREMLIQLKDCKDQIQKAISGNKYLRDRFNAKASEVEKLKSLEQQLTSIIQGLKENQPPTKRPRRQGQGQG